MKAKIVRIGNSRGIRIPKPLLEEAGLGEQVELRIVDGGIMIAAETGPRAGWAEPDSMTLTGNGRSPLSDPPW